jgi:hypothetical protein
MTPDSWEIARRRCAARIRAELFSYRPPRPLALRDELRLRGMAARCATCRACPATVRILAAMAPAASGTDVVATDAPVRQVLRLAS